MDAGGPGLLCEALDEHFHFLGRHVHEVRKFIDNDQDIGHFLVGILLVISFNISHLGAGKELVAGFHFTDRPVECALGLLHIGNHFRSEMGNAVVHGQFHHLRVDEHELHILRTAVVNDTCNDGINAHRFAGARGTGNEKMRHFCQVRHHRLPCNILAQGHQDVAFAIFEFTAVKHIP